MYVNMYIVSLGTSEKAMNPGLTWNVNSIGSLLSLLESDMSKRTLNQNKIKSNLLESIHC